MPVQWGVSPQRLAAEAASAFSQDDVKASIASDDVTELIDLERERRIGKARRELVIGDAAEVVVVRVAIGCHGVLPAASRFQCSQRLQSAQARLFGAAFGSSRIAEVPVAHEDVAQLDSAGSIGIRFTRCGSILQALLRWS